MRKGLVVFVMLFGMVAWTMGSPCSAEDATSLNVTNTNQLGSLLIFPKIVTYSGVDTYLLISNQATSSGSINVECIYETPGETTTGYFPETSSEVAEFTQYQVSIDIGFSLSPGQVLEIDVAAVFEPYWLTIYNDLEFPGFGEIKCFATNADYNAQVKFNYLSGQAKIVDTTIPAAVEYQAWAFKADPINYYSTTGVYTAGSIGPAGTIKLDGMTYDACPQFYIGQVFGTGSNQQTQPGSIGVVANDLTLVTCKDDARSLNVPTYTQAYFTNESPTELVRSGAAQCFICWFEGLLDTLTNGANIFNTPSLSGAFNPGSRFWVTGIAQGNCPPLFMPVSGNGKCLNGQKQTTVTIAGTQYPVCPDLEVNTPLIGVLIEAIVPIETGVYDFTAISGFTSGIDTTGWVKWDLGYPIDD